MRLCIDAFDPTLVGAVVLFKVDHNSDNDVDDENEDDEDDDDNDKDKDGGGGGGGGINGALGGSSC
jgi:hypothetical protein